MGRPKGSKNKQYNKQQKHPKVTVDEVKVNLEVEGNSLHTCYVCDRDYADQPLGFNVWRHKGCELGSFNWKQWYVETHR